MKYILYGNPVPLARPRFSDRKIYDSQKQLKNDILLQLLHQHAGRPQLTGPVEINVNFYLPISKARRANDGKSKLDGKYHTYRPDLSNLIKLIEDVGNGLMYKDDSCVCKISAQKFFSTEPRTEFEVTEIK